MSHLPLLGVICRQSDEEGRERPGAPGTGRGSLVRDPEKQVRGLCVQVTLSRDSESEGSCSGLEVAKTHVVMGKGQTPEPSRIPSLFIRSLMQEAPS